MSIEEFNHFSYECTAIQTLIMDNHTTTTKLIITGIILVIIVGTIIMIRQQKIIKMLRELKEQDKP